MKFDVDPPPNQCACVRYAHSRYTRLLGVDALNRFLAKPFWGEKDPYTGVYRHILPETSAVGTGVADGWRSVPFLGEWSCDGVVMSSEAPEVYHGSGRLDSQLYNIAVQGACPVNNGYCDQSMNGQIARSLPSNISDDPAKYTGTNYHLYPLQMFDREVSPLDELFVGLVAVRHEAPDAATLAAYAEASATLEGFATATSEDLEAWPALTKAAYDDARQQLDKINKELQATYEGYRSAGWWDGTPTGASSLGGPGQPFYSFKYVTFTSRTAEYLNVDVGPGSIDIFVPSGGKAVKRLKSEADQYDSPTQRAIDFKHMVGAWRIGKVLDVKAQKMPWFPSGPSETGYRVTTNVDIEWWDWRKLRRTYTNSAGATQIAEDLESIGTAKWYTDDKLKQDAGRIFQWPTDYDSNLEKKLLPLDPEQRIAFLKNHINIPVNPENREQSAQDYIASRPDLNKVGVVPSARPVGNALSLLRTSKKTVLPAMPARGATHEHHLARVGAAMDNLRMMVAPATEEERREAAAYVAQPGVAAAAEAEVATAVARQASSSPSKAASKQSVAPTSSATPGRSAPAPVARPSASSAATSANAGGGSTSGGVATASASGSRRARSATTAADVFSNIFGSSAAGGADSSAPQPLNPQHRSSPGGDAGGGAGTTGRSFSRRKAPKE